MLFWNKISFFVFVLNKLYGKIKLKNCSFEALSAHDYLHSISLAKFEEKELNLLVSPDVPELNFRVCFQGTQII